MTGPGRMSPARPPALMFGVPIADVTMTETIEIISGLVARGRAESVTHQIATVNVDFLVNATESRELLDILRGADLCLADGMPIVWGARALGTPVAERVAGSDLVPNLVAASATTGHHVHIFGSTAEVAKRATAMLTARYPRARFSIDPGPMLEDPRRVGHDLIESIRSVDADILCVALGNPKQEYFIAANRERLGTPVLIGVGGSLDMLVGERRRAPVWLQRIGFEWVFRALQEPRRLGRRYAHDLHVFGPRLVSEVWSTRSRRHRSELRFDDVDRTVRLVPADAPGTPADAAQVLAHAACKPRVDVRLEAGGAILDCAGLAVLVGLATTVRLNGDAVAWQFDRPSDRAELLARLAAACIPAHLVGIESRAWS